MTDRTIGEGWGLRLGLSAAAVAVVALVLLLPLAVVFTQALAAGLGPALQAIGQPDALASIRLTLLVAAISVPVNTALGIAAAWALTCYRFPGRAALRTLIGVPFAVSPVVAGLAIVLLFGTKGWFGAPLQALGIPVVFALPGIVLCTVFVTIPFVAGQLIPLMEAQGADEEAAALTLGAGFWQILLLVTLPRVRWALAFGVLLCNARAMGEFGAVAVVSGRIRGVTTTMPLMVEALYQEYDMVGAFALAALLALLALLTVAARAGLEWRQRRVEQAGAGARLSA